MTFTDVIALLQNEKEKYSNLDIQTGVYVQETPLIQRLVLFSRPYMNNPMNYDKAKKVRIITGETILFGESTPFLMSFYESKLAEVVLDIKTIEKEPIEDFPSSNYGEGIRRIGFVYPNIREKPISYCTTWGYYEPPALKNTLLEASSACGKSPILITNPDSMSSMSLSHMLDWQTSGNHLIYRNIEKNQQLLSYIKQLDITYKAELQQRNASKAKGEL